MNVMMEDQLVVQNLDLVAVTGGPFRAHAITTLPIPVNDGTLTITLSATVGQPMISGLEIIEAANIVTHRINCGATSNTLITMNGNTWSKDQYAASGATSNRCIKNNITNSIYCSSHYFRTSLGTPLRYNIPVPYNNALYALKLHFNEHVSVFLCSCDVTFVAGALTQTFFIGLGNDYSTTTRSAHEFMMYWWKTH